MMLGVSFVFWYAWGRIIFWFRIERPQTGDCTIKPHFECVVCTCKENISDHISQDWLLQQKGDSQTGRLEFLLSLSKLAQHFCCWWLGYNCGLKGSYFMESWCFYIQVNLAIKYIESWFRPINPFDFKSWVASYSRRYGHRSNIRINKKLKGNSTWHINKSLYAVDLLGFYFFITADS